MPVLQTRNLISLLCLFAALAIFPKGSASAAGCFNDCDDPWIIRLEGAAAAGQFIGQDRDYVQLGAFIAPEPCGDWFFFSDLQGYWLEGNRFAANAGLGVRWFDRCNGRLIGANVYYDYFEGRHGGFNRIGIGLESLGECLDFRINGYLPVNDSVSSSGKTYTYPGGYSAILKEREFAYKGVDGEVGYQIYRGCDVDLYGAIGPYYYHADDLPKVYGGQLRLELRFLEFFTLEGLFSDDNHYHAKAQGKIGISIPLESITSCCFTRDRCKEFYARDTKRNGLPFFSNCCDWKWNW